MIRRMLIAAIAASLAILTVLGAGCASSTEHDAVREVVCEELELVKLADKGFVDEVVAGMGAAALDAYGVDSAEFVEEYLAGFDYEIGAIEIDGDSATAAVVMTCKSYSTYLKQLTEATMSLEAGGSLDGMDSRELGERLGALMMSVLSESKPVECSPCDIRLVKTDGAWEIADETEGVIASVLFGN